MEPRREYLAEQFHTPAQQRHATFLGIWVFLATELMMFGAVFLLIYYYRAAYPEAVAQAMGHLHYVLAGINSAFLLTGSLCMTLVVEASRRNHVVRLKWMLAAAALLGTLFLATKGFEYAWEYHEGLIPPSRPDSPLDSLPARLYMNVYLVATGLHALHVLIAVAIVAGMLLRVHTGHMQLPERAVTLEVVSFYWHLVDVIWILLYASLYLVGRGA